MAALELAFVMDPIGSIDTDKDTTFVLMLEAQARGHAVQYLELPDLMLRSGRTWGRMRRARVRRGSPHYELGPPEARPLADMDAVFMRKDPPYDMGYFYATHLLDPALSGTWVLNGALGLREATEKLFGLRFPELIPRTHLASDPAELKRLLDELGGRMVVKRLDGSGGSGVFLVRDGDPNLSVILESSTHFGRTPVLAQEYLEAASRGDKRLIVIGGEPAGAVLRVPRTHNEFRANIHVGATCVHADVDDRDREICARLRPEFARLGLELVGLDVIAGYVTEINVTSPTGFQEIRNLSGVALEGRMLDLVEDGVRSRRSSGAAASARA
ncbi:MAG: glutathione synthase [bacterium]